MNEHEKQILKSHFYNLNGYTSNLKIIINKNKDKIPKEILKELKSNIESLGSLSHNTQEELEQNSNFKPLWK